MTPVVFDASALLAFLKSEPGAARVEQALAEGGFCSAANWAEVAQKSSGLPFRWERARAVLRSFGLTIVPVIEADAERAAVLWAPGTTWSLADRLCLALADRLELPALTADRAWAEHPRAQLIR
ncbi:type II toxin-antitoxin system VapC family toxin [Gryllotalpicola reticulitermitis]|uniref:Type II toxin-antitoxin system VapC family toxin n=1 Tax=Gryllotalpicola reticulitermitis TaxID=1184153 RepID=A0ABV8Q976_9MICO